MRAALGFVMAMALLSITVWAQRPGEQARPSEPERGEMQRPVEPGRNVPHANQGRIPQPPSRRVPDARPEAERKGGHVNDMPHVNDDRWYGHDRPNDRHYHLDRPFEHGHFEHFGPNYRYSILRIDPDLHRLWLPGGYFFQVAPWDWPLCADWCWSCGGDDFVIYEDPDHPGWYLLYNLETGRFVHVLYMGM